MAAAALVIAAHNLMPALRERVEMEPGTVLTYPDTEPIQALQTIMEQRPGLVVLERLFAATPRGAALINRIKSDPQLAHVEVRVMSHNGDYSRQVVKPSAPIPSPAPPLHAATASAVEAVVESAVESVVESVATEEVPRSIDWHGTRRAPRFRVHNGIELQLDGNPAELVDLSTVGAQVTSPTVLRPNQKVRINLPNDDFVLRFRGAIVWAKFELPTPPATTPHYRAGIEFVDGDTKAIDSIIAKSRA